AGEGLAEADALAAADKVDHVTGRAAPEAVERLRLGVDAEARRPVLVEGAASHEPSPLPAQLHALPFDHTVERVPALHLFDVWAGHGSASPPAASDGSVV